MAKRSDYIGQNKNFHCLWRPPIVCFSPLCTQKLEGPSFLYTWRFFFYKICSVLRGGIQHLKKRCHGRPAIEQKRAKTSDRKHAFGSLCWYSRIALFPRARNTRTFPANWQVDIFLFDTSLNHGVGGRGSLKNFLQALSLPSSPSSSLIFFLSLSLFPRPQLPRAWNRLTLL